MSLRSRLAIIGVFSIAMVLFSIAPGSEAVVSETFDDGLFSYQVLSDDTVNVNRYNEGKDITNLVIPNTVVHDAKTYKVTMMSCYLNSPYIESISIPKNIESIYYPGLIFDCINLENIEVDIENEHYMTIDGVLFDYTGHVLLKYPSGKQSAKYVVPEMVSKIGDIAFDECVLEEIELGKGLIEIGALAFNKCANLSKINFDGTKNSLPDQVSILGYNAFAYCSSLKNLTLSESLRVIGEWCFTYSGITYINIPSSVITIGNGAFSFCFNLERIDSDCARYVKSGEALCSKDRTQSIIAYPCNCKNSTYVITPDISYIESMAFAGAQHVEEIILSPEIQFIPDYSFAYCTSLKTIDLSRVAYISSGAFDGCTSLCNVTFSNILTTIEDGAFKSCNLQELTLPASLKTISTNSFINNNNLKKVVFPAQCQTNVMSYSFEECFSLEEIIFEGDEVTFENSSLSVGTPEHPVSINITKHKDLSIPEKAWDHECTTLIISDIGERPYPYENLIGVAFCILVLIAIIRLFRGV